MSKVTQADIDEMLSSMTPERQLELEEKLGMVPSAKKSNLPKRPKEKKCKFAYKTVKVKIVKSCILCGSVLMSWHFADVLSTDHPEESAIDSYHKTVNETVLSCELCHTVLSEMEKEDVVQRAIRLSHFANNRYIGE